MRSSEFGLAALRVVSWRELGVLEGKVKNFRGKGELGSLSVGAMRFVNRACPALCSSV